MPSIVVTPKYNPFTFDELYRPLAETTKMQMALEDQYNAMEMEAAKLAALFIIFIMVFSAVASFIVMVM